MKKSNRTGRLPARADTASARQEAVLELGTQLSALLAAARAFSVETAAAFDPPLSSAKFQVIQSLYASGPSRAMQIAQHLAMDRSASSRLLAQLAADGLVESTPDPADKRATIYGLTATAKKHMTAATADKGWRFAQRLESWSEADLRQLSGLLRRLIAPS